MSTRRSVNARRVAACVEAAVLAGSAVACGASATGAPTAPAAGTGVGATASGADPAASGSPAAVDRTGPATTTSTPATELTIRANTVSPATLTVSPGQSLAITNSDAFAHDLTDAKDKLNSGIIKASGGGSLTAPRSAGTFHLSDPNHKGTRLTLVVN